ncbi:hypothetical protein [Deinococcus misasensis]|uniref:hypothetical protein n=1 Tax=Deinococcus misasensis TaxID=392413 RepID=UPI000553FB57|nr:hypothetical protein [Deinococcus misasensis]
MPHTQLPTLHLNPVSPEAAQGIQELADLTYCFGPLEDFFTPPAQQRQLQQKLGLDLPGLCSPCAHQSPLENAILNLASRQRSHTVLVIHLYENQGYVCLLPNERLQDAEKVLYGSHHNPERYRH